MRKAVLLSLFGLFFLGCGKPAEDTPSQIPQNPVYQGKEAGQWIEDFKSGDHETRVKAVEVLGAMGKDARSAIPELTKALQEEDLRVQVSETLGKLGADAVPSLIQNLGDPSMAVRRRAGVALASIGKPAVSALIGVLKDGNPRIRQEAAVALGMMGPDAKEAVPDLVLLLKDGEKWVRYYAADALGFMGSGARAAEEALEDLKAEDPWCRGKAMESLKRIGGN